MRKKSAVKKTVIILFLGFFVGWGLVKISNNRVIASPPAPAPKCYVKGLIENVRFEKAYENPCVKNDSCPTDVQLSYPDTYYLSVKIQNVSFKEGDTRFQTCESLYSPETSQEIFIIRDRIKSGDLFNKGQVIEGTVSSFWGKSFDSYNILSGQDSNQKPTLPETWPITTKPPLNIFDRIKIAFGGIFEKIYNFLTGVKTTQTQISIPIPSTVPPTNTNPYKEPPASKEVNDIYLPVWKQIFTQQNSLSENYFKNHIEILNTSTNEWIEGTSFVVLYRVKVGWANAIRRDAILIKSKGSTDFLPASKILENVKVEPQKNEVAALIPIESIISYDLAINNLKSQCHQSLKPPQEDAVRLEQGIKLGKGELFLLANGTIDRSKNQCGFGKLRLSDGQVTECYLNSPCVVY